jgi:isoquinoline 1-oxidoreductase beta subunit
MNSTLSRRQFLKVSAATGLVLSLHLAGPTGVNAAGSKQARPAATETFQPNLFLRLAADNTVTITIPRSEMGQGVRTSMAMIVAEELDADWSTVRVEQAPANTAYGDQYTGGSTSIKFFWQPLREAGAVARAMLIAAAAQQWGVDPATCTTDKSKVIHPAGEPQLSYGELATAAAQLPVPEPAGLVLKKPENFKIIGVPIGPIDNPQIVDGKAIFGLDTRMPDMLYAAIARPPVFGGKLVSFEASAATAIEGVRKVVQIDNAVAVVAEHTWAALQGREALKINWDETAGANLNSETIRQNILAQLPTPDSDQASTTGQLEAIYEVPYFAHMPMEPMNCVAEVGWNGGQVWAPTQHPQGALSQLPGGRLVRFVNQRLGLGLEVVKANVTLMGGGFGRRLEVDYVNEAVQVSQAVGAPVQVVWTREDDIQHDFYHPFSIHHLSAKLDPLAEIEEQVVTGPPEIPTGAWRAVENFTQGFVRESFVDELAAALGQDPLQLRLERAKNQPRLKAVLELAAEKGNWGSPLPEGWGRGIAAYATWGESPTAEVVEVAVSDDGQVRVQRVVCVIDCGIVVNPDMVAAQMEGGIVFALTAALKSQITVKDGRVQQSNFHNYPILRMDEMPAIEVYIVPSTEPPTGVGEMSGPPLTPAVANAIFAATGKRVRRIPIQADDLRQA